MKPESRRLLERAARAIRAAWPLEGPKPIPRFALQFRCARVLLVAIGLTTGIHETAAGPLFAAPFLSFDVGVNPLSVVIGDFVRWASAGTMMSLNLVLAP